MATDKAPDRAPKDATWVWRVEEGQSYVLDSTGAWRPIYVLDRTGSLVPIRVQGGGVPS